MDSKDILRFLSNVKDNGENSCHDWLRSHFKNGYGQFKLQRMSLYAHRVAYEIANGPFPSHMLVRHTCDNRGCVNPKHLLLGTQLDNMRDARERNRQSKGEAHGRAKLSDREVREIYDLYQSGLFTQKWVADQYGVNHATVSHINSGWSRTSASDVFSENRKRG